MAKQMSVMMFGKYEGMKIEQVPTDHLLWVFGSFPKLRNKLRGVLSGRGLSLEEIERRSSCHEVLGKWPVSDEKREEKGKNKPTKNKKPTKWKRLTRSDEELRANDVARAMGMEIPYPRHQVPIELRYFSLRGQV